MKLLTLSLFLAYSITLRPMAGAQEPAAPTATTTAVQHTTGQDAKALLDANAEAAAAGKAAKITVLDVRTPDEFAEGHLANAKNIDFKGADFAKQIAALDKTQPYLVHCGGGHRSTSSLEIFQKLGFKTIIHLDGGLTSWTKAGHPVVK